MAREQKDNSGIIFKNDNKKTENHPDRTGHAMIGGREYFVSAWLKKDRNGDAFLSLAFKPKDAARVAKPSGSAPVAPKYGADLDDEIPFAPSVK